MTNTQASKEAREAAEDAVSAANVVSHDGYYELDIDAVAEHFQRAMDQSALAEREAWQPIETAPDDTWFIGRWYAATKTGECRWVCVEMRKTDTMAGRQYFETWDYRLLVEPTHWMPIPAIRERQT